MTEILKFKNEDFRPDRQDVLSNQGIMPGEVLPAAIERLCSDALDLLSKVAEPIGVMLEVEQAEFTRIYAGEGLNETSTPVGDIYPRAEDLALFAVTLGARVPQEIKRRFDGGDLAIGAMLDAAASVATDRLAAETEARFKLRLMTRGRDRVRLGVLRYSPGYCGWHISGQKKLFEKINPQQVGIALRESYLMEPLKSVSGVIIAGPAEIHNFRMSYRYCEKCRARGCRERIRTLLAG